MNAPAALPPPQTIARECRLMAASADEFPIWTLPGTSSPTWDVYQVVTWCKTEEQAMPRDILKESLPAESCAKLEMKEKARQYIREITEFQESCDMSAAEVAYFQNLRAKPFMSLTPDKMRRLPLRKK
jgi:hypothetical protein